MEHNKYMDAAYQEALQAYDKEEVPVGAVVVYNNQIIGRGHNVRETQHQPSGHAEIIAMDQAGETLGSWNLEGCTLYVTLEPCAMCTGAIMQSRVSTVVYGSKEPKSGCLGSVIDFTKIEGYNHYPEVIAGIQGDKTKQLMLDFFKQQRNKQVKIKKVDESMFKRYLDVRKKVFVDEQNIDPSEEYDELDILDHQQVSHVVAMQQNHVIGTMRLYCSDRTMKIGRLAVLKPYRNKKIASKLVRYAIIQAENNGIDKIELNAQLSAMNIYKRQGFEITGEIYEEVGISHIKMIKHIKTPI
ncbi:tRNA adenosine(34) deaminase TadA [Erysipelothrix piscisicarius]